MLRISNLSKHYGELPIFENFDLRLPCNGFIVLKCCDHEFRVLFQLMGSGFLKTLRLLYWPWALLNFFAEEVLEIKIFSPSDRLKLKVDVQNVLWVGEK